MSLQEIWPYALAVVLLVALVILILLVLLLRKSAKSSQFVDAEEPADENAPAEEPREVAAADVSGAFRRAAKFIDRAADGDRKDVPLFLVVGDRGSRDSELFGDAGLELTWGQPEEAGTSLGEGRGFWIYDQGVVLDVVGEEAAWDDVVAQLRRLRPKRPIDGVIVTLACAELLEAVTSEVKRTDLAARAAKTYRRLWDAQQRIGFRLPTYVLVTGCEAVTGFRSLCASLHDHGRRQIVGWSNPNGLDSVYRAAWVDDAFQALARRLDDVSMEVFAEGTKDGDLLLRLTPGLTSLATALRPVIEGLFKSSAYHGTLIFRGLYFCGRESAPASEDAPPAGPVAFLAEVLGRKVFVEHRLAAPTTRTVMARNRAVSIAKTTAAAMLVLALLSVGWAALTFRRQNLVLEPVLNSAAEAMETNDGRALPAAALGKNAIALLNGMSAIDFDRYDSAVVPVSWFAPFQTNLEHAFTDAFHDIILRAIRADLEAKAKSLVPLDEPRIVPYAAPDRPAEASVPGAAPMMSAGGAAEGEALPPPWVDERVTPIASLPQFQAMRGYVKALNELDENVAAFNQLHESGDLRQVGRLVRYSFGIELPESFYRKSHLYRHALLRAEYKKIENDPVFRAAAARKLNRLADELHESVFRRNPFAARLQRLSSTIRNVTWQPPASGDTTPLLAISEQLKRLDADLSGPELEWAFKREFDFGAEYKSMLDDIAGTTYFGAPVSMQVRDAAAARWGRFQQGLTWASTPLTKTVLAVHDDRPEMQLSNESVLLQSALQTFLGQPFVMSGRRAAPIRTDLTEGFRLQWNTAALDQAVAVAQAYDRFRTGTLLLFPPDVRISIDQVARERAVGELLDALARARMEERIEYVDSASQREEQIRLDVARFNAFAPVLESTMDAASRLSPDAGRLVAGTVSAEAVRVLRNIDASIERDRPYATFEDLARWDGSVPPSPRAWAKQDEAELASWLEATRGRVAFVAMNYAKPLLAWLAKSHTANTPAVRDLVVNWQAIVDDVRDHDTKKPGNAIAVLEDYIAVRMAKVTAADCTAAVLPPGFRVRSYFGRTAQELSQQVRQRCLELAGRDSSSRYAAIERYFNQRLAGRYPFADGLPRAADAEADPADVRAFFRLFDENKAALTAPAAQGGLGVAQNAQRKFLEDMAVVRAFFASFLDAPKPELAPSLDLEATFRVLKPREIDGQQIIGWTAEVGDQVVTNRQAAKKIRWTAGQPVRVTLRWAADSPRIPAVAGQRRAALDGDRKVVWEYANRWSLLAALADHPVRAEELPGYADALPVTLAFDLATTPAAGPPTDVTPVRVFMRLALLAPGTNQPLDLPRFPASAPQMASALEAAR